MRREKRGTAKHIRPQTSDPLTKSQLNVVLDYNKFENANLQVQNPRVRENASTAFPAPAQPFFVQADVDLALLVEDATETVVAGHFFDNLPGIAYYDDDDNASRNSYRAGQGRDRGTTQDVKVILQLSARPSWSVKTSPGAISRIVMNIVGNALKFTSTGNICIDLAPHRRC
jgi:signal transduction histidine kinase